MLRPGRCDGIRAYAGPCRAIPRDETVALQAAGRLRHGMRPGQRPRLCRTAAVPLKPVRKLQQQMEAKDAKRRSLN